MSLNTWTSDRVLRESLKNISRTTPEAAASVPIMLTFVCDSPGQGGTMGYTVHKAMIRSLKDNGTFAGVQSHWPTLNDERPSSRTNLDRK
jgi:hypothetical protein